MSELTTKTAAELGRLIAAGETSAVEVAQAHLDRIAAVDDRVHAFLHVDAEGALAAATAIDMRRAAGETLPPLAGVPVALKDVLTTKGVPTTCRIQDPGGLAAAVRRHDRRAAARRRSRDPRQDEHGRVRDGLVDGVFGVRADAQPVGSRADSGRLRRRIGGVAGRVRGAAGDRVGHRWIHPPARRGHRDGGCQADVRRHVPLRPRSPSRPVWTRRDRVRGRSRTPRCCMRSSPATIPATRRRSRLRSRTSSRPRARVPRATCPAYGSAWSRSSAARARSPG